MSSEGYLEGQQKPMDATGAGSAPGRIRQLKWYFLSIVPIFVAIIVVPGMFFDVAAAGVTRIELGAINQSVANPGDADALIERGTAKAATGDLQGVINDDSQVLEIDAGDEYNVYAFNGRGYMKALMGDYQGAIEDYNKALDINHNFSQALSSRGYAKLHSGNYKGAREDAEKAMAMKPRNKYTKRVLAWINEKLKRKK